MNQGKRKVAAETRLAWIFGLGILFVFLATSGGRITSSDGHTMFLLTQGVIERGEVAVPEGNAERGPDGRLYPKAGIGQALASVPFYAAGKLAATAFPSHMRPFVLRGATSLLSAFAGAVLAVVLLLLFLELGLIPREALTLATVAVLGTPLWVYAKLYSSEILLALALSLVLYGVVRLRHGGSSRSAAVTGLGVGLAWATKYAVFPAAALLSLPAVTEFRRWRKMLPGFLIAAVLVGISLYYNELRSGSPWQSGYGRQGTLEAFTTPLWVGLLGLLLSSGKGLLWFAPITALVPASMIAWLRRDWLQALSVTMAVGASILLYAGFEHWAGDGSWGPRYLVPLIPLLVAVVGARLADRSLPRRRLWWSAVVSLGVLGFVVQIGGVFISVGAHMREAGDYPYELPLNHPRFMSESHWNPYFTPIAGHWSMLRRNLGEHLEGRWPRVSMRAARGRLGIDEAVAARLTHGIDTWPAYAIYAGLPLRPVLAVWLLLWGLAAGYLFWAWRDSGLLAPRPGSTGVKGDEDPRGHPAYKQIAEEEAKREWSFMRGK